MRGYLAGSEARLTEPVAGTNHGPFAACLSAGPDGVAVANHSPQLKRKIGRTAYALSFARLLARWPRQQFALDITVSDGSKNSLTCEAFYIAKGRYFAGPWSLTPEAGMGNDHFHLITLSRASRWHYLRFMLAIARGKDPENLPFARPYRTRTVTIQNPQESMNVLFFQEDGDSMMAAPQQITMTGHVVEYCLPRDH